MNYTYESSEMFLSMVQKEYEIEKERAAALDSKIALSLPVISAYFLLLVQDKNIRKLWLSITKADTVQSLKAVKSLLLLLCVLAIGTALVALVFMIRSTWAHNFKGVDITQAHKMRSMSTPKGQFSAQMVAYYLQSVKRNRTENSIRAGEYQFAWVFGIISLVCFLLYAFFMQFL